MTRTLRYLLLLVLTGFAGRSVAQEIAGKVVDEKKEPMINAVIQAYAGGIQRGGTVTDYDGNFSIKPLDPGYYDVLAIYQGYDSVWVKKVEVFPGSRTVQNFNMMPHTKALKEVQIIQYKRQLIDHEKTAFTMGREDIAVLPTTEVTDLVGLTPGIYQAQRGTDVNIGGARTSGTQYIIDGVAVQGTIGINMAQGSIDQIEVITSGIPANYGDVSGGIVNLTSRGVAPKLTGDIHVQHSIDGYNNNMVNFSIAGPIYKKKIQNGDIVVKKPVLGFSLSGDYYYDNDRYPSYYETYVTNPSVLKQLQQNPLTIISDASGNPVYNYSSDYINANQLHQVKIPPMNLLNEYRMNGKLSYQVADNMNLSGGGMVDYTKSDGYGQSAVLFAPGAVAINNTLAGRAYLKFTQKFGKIGDTSSRHSIISNAYYSIQADFQKTYESSMDPNFKTNIFDYAYNGKFYESRENLYQVNGTDSATGRPGTVLIGNFDDGINYAPSNLNPLLSNYTKEFYAYNQANDISNPTSITAIQAHNALANGDEPLSTYGLFASPGATQGGYSIYNSNQYSLSVDASFDLLLGKIKHSIGFGLYYQQRVEESYSINANLGGSASIWQLMRGLVSSVDNGNLVLDKTNPVFVVDGKKYTLAQVNSGQINPGPTDTILYNYKNIGSGLGNNTGTYFDQSLRKKLGVGADSSINIDVLTPNQLSLNMFDADELLNGGNPFVNYYGYSYLGANQSAVNFDDFWTAKDANGNYTRPIPAFSPNYVAGYLLDKFTYKDVHFNLGVRVDRYDANTDVLIDPYSEYPEKNVSQVPGSDNSLNGGHHPANMAGNYIVYVDDNSSTAPSVVGYRNGNNWYDAKGNLIQDPSVLQQYTGGRAPQPYLVNPNVHITDTNFNPNQSFTNYSPQINIQPRIQFSFPISDVADFYAHYDIYEQRPYPSSIGYATAYNYYYLSQNANSVIGNPALQPQRTIDYEVGFQQKLTSSSKLSLSAFYKERDNMMTIVPILYAWPTSYYTYGNRDFSTTKGTTINYDLRATNHLRMTVSYTLSFAEGTGSTPFSTNSNGGSYISPNGLLQQFILAGLPNERYITPLNYDSRHNLSATIEYRYRDNEGPTVKGKKIFQNMGINFVPTARSGEPYTELAAAQGNTVVGGVNGARLPWHYNLDLNLDKDFAINNLRRHVDAPEGVKPKRPLYIKAIFQVKNVLNTKDVLGVYGYTGKANDNGYLASPWGQQYVPQQINPSSYTTLYQISENAASGYNYHRTAIFGLELNF